MTKKQSCETCVYFHKEGPNPRAVGAQLYSCHAYPPQVISAAPGHVASMFPPTLPESWCGEWTPKERGGTA